ncbi:MAG: CpaD family pilus assembly lipoprotein [Pseudomonadota bacterium]
MMFARKFVLAALLPAAMLGGCSSYRGLESRHQPVVSRTDYVFDVASNGYGLAGGESARLAGWLASLRVGYGDTVSVDDPVNSSGARQEVAAQAASRGLLLSDTAPVTAGPVAPGTLRVVVSRATARVPGCPDFFGEDHGTNFDAHTSANYGCGSNATLAAMVANPVDLVRGQPGANTLDPATSTKAIDAYRKAAPTGGGGTTVKPESTGGGK